MANMQIHHLKVRLRRLERQNRNPSCNEAAVEELYGDTKPEEWKQEEIKRLNARDGVEVMKEPALNMEGLEMEG